MKRIGWILSFGLVLLAFFATSAYAQTPREELQQMVEQLQKSPNDNALREKIIVLATSIKPALAIPEEAREPFVMGATVLKKASDPAGASKAVDLFTQALNIAPWFADAYYNRAIAREAAGQFESAIDDIKFYLEFKLTDSERREAQDKIYSLKADAQLGSAKKAEAEQNAKWQEWKKRLGQAQQKYAKLIQRLDGAVFLEVFESGGVIQNYEMRFQKGDVENDYMETCVTRYKTVQSSDPKYPVMSQWEVEGNRFVWPVNESQFDGCRMNTLRLSSDAQFIFTENNTESYRRQ